MNRYEVEMRERRSRVGRALWREAKLRCNGVVLSLGLSPPYGAKLQPFSRSLFILGFLLQLRLHPHQCSFSSGIISPLGSAKPQLLFMASSCLQNQCYLGDSYVSKFGCPLRSNHGRIFCVPILRKPFTEISACLTSTEFSAPADQPQPSQESKGFTSLKLN